MFKRNFTIPPASRRKPQLMSRIHAFTEPLAVAALIGAAAGNLTPRGPLAVVLVVTLVVLGAVTAVKTLLGRRAAHRGYAETYSITDVFDQVNALWDERTPETVWERDPIPGYIGRHRAPELVAA